MIYLFINGKGAIKKNAYPAKWRNAYIYFVIWRSCLIFHGRFHPIRVRLRRPSLKDDGKRVS